MARGIGGPALDDARDAFDGDYPFAEVGLGTAVVFERGGLVRVATVTDRVEDMDGAVERYEVCLGSNVVARQFAWVDEESHLAAFESFGKAVGYAGFLTGKSPLEYAKEWGCERRAPRLGRPGRCRRRAEEPAGHRATRAERREAGPAMSPEEVHEADVSAYQVAFLGRRYFGTCLCGWEGPARVDPAVARAEADLHVEEES